MNFPIKKENKKQSNKEDCLDLSKEAKSMAEKIFGDVSKTSATKQIIIGTTSGWLTGFITMKVGKMAAFALGGGIIMLQIAAHQGYIKVNWDKIQKKAEKITDTVEEKVGIWCRKNSFVATGFFGGFMIGLNSLFQVERYVDKKLDKAEQLLKNGESRTRRWYHSITGDTSFQATELHFFFASFIAGLALGIATGN
ncbi:FUN14 domain-containing protein 1 [Habropoda laboriosa]|uniref:FUN14 domain-containing protein 1 n=1 Tax=Habropoda laboriosa TaxID=597456 RepID=A0A0L7R419_9HYME|nr:FUN14 domain-containing protein 1 [Habropoda laboriosa]